MKERMWYITKWILIISISLVIIVIGGLALLFYLRLKTSVLNDVITIDQLQELLNFILDIVHPPENPGE